MLRRILAALCALALAIPAQAQTYRPGFGLGRPGFQFLQSTAGALCPNSSIAFYDFQADTGCSAGVNAANSTANLTTSRASIGYDLAATTQFAANVARRTAAGLLDEAAATNQLFASSDYTSATWTKGGVSTTQNLASPASVANAASTLTATASGVPNFYNSSAAGAVASGSVVTVSAFMQAGSASIGFIQVNNSTFSASAAFAQFFNLANGTVGTTQTLIAGYTNISAAIRPAGNGWYRVAVTFTANTAGNATYIGMASADGSRNATSGQTIGLWEVNVAVANAASSTIPTTTAAATRAADNITLTLPTGVTKVDLVYSTGTTTVTVSPGTYTLPPNPANSNLLQLKAYAG